VDPPKDEPWVNSAFLPSISDLEPGGIQLTDLVRQEWDKAETEKILNGVKDIKIDG